MANQSVVQSFRPPAVILAGGRSSRIGPVGRLIPKSLLPISGHETLLTRQIRFLLEAGFETILISTSPDNYQLYELFISRYKEDAELQSHHRGASQIRVIENAHHSSGPSHALLHLLGETTRQGFLLCLSDICYPENPFFFKDKLLGPGSAELIVGPYRRSVGGVIMTANGRVSSISYVALSADLPVDCEAYNWTGAALFHEDAVDSLLKGYQPSKEDDPLESMLEHLLDQGMGLEISRIDGFINANSWIEYTTTFAWA